MRKYERLGRIVYDANEFVDNEEFQEWMKHVQIDHIQLVDNPSSFEDCLWITGRKEYIELAKKQNIAVLGYQRAGAREFLPVEHVIWQFEGIDETYLERVFWRCNNIPWTILETERCVIREFAMEDLDALFELYAKPGMTNFVEPLYEYEEEAEYERAYIKHRYRYYGYGMWLVFDKKSGELIGRAGLEDREYAEDMNQEIQEPQKKQEKQEKQEIQKRVETQEKQETQESMDMEIKEGSQNMELELGYMIAPEYQRKGYATEICQAIIQYAGEELEYNSVNCLIEPENAASIGLMKKLDFEYKGITGITGKPMCRYVRDIKSL